MSGELTDVDKVFASTIDCQRRALDGAR